jgi:phosphoribosylformylglycinamidine (FGAM) synthase PurS component
MRALDYYNTKQMQVLEVELVKIIRNIYFQLGHKSTAEDMAAMAKIMANDLVNNPKFSVFTVEDVSTAFYNGLRSGEDKLFFNVPTYTKWLYAYKTIHAANYLKEYKEREAKYIEDNKTAAGFIKSNISKIKKIGNA